MIPFSPVALPGDAVRIDLDLPPPLAHILVPIAASRVMLYLPDDWDGEVRPAYAESTWRRAVAFLTDAAKRLWEDRGVAVSAPRLRKGPVGSIDLHSSCRHCGSLSSTALD